MYERMVKIYYCDYCNKGFRNITYTKKHEEKCFNNPVNKKCGSCGLNNNGTCLHYKRQLVTNLEPFVGRTDKRFFVYPENCKEWGII